MAVSPIASSTAPNWLKEAQESIAATENPGGLMGMLQDSRATASIKNFLIKSQSTANAMQLINSSTAQSMATLTLQRSDAAQQKLQQEKVAMLMKLNPQQSNFNPAKQLDSFIYFQDGSSIDTVSNSNIPGTIADSTRGAHAVAGRTGSTTSAASMTASCTTT